jgi:hypothetical protein
MVANVRLSKIFIKQSLAGRDLHPRTIEASRRRCGEKTAALRPDMQGVAIVQEWHSGNATLCELCIAPAQFYLRRVDAQESRAKDTVKV